MFVCVCVYIYIYIYMCVYIFMCMYTYLSVCIFMRMYTYLCVSIYLCVCVCVCRDVVWVGGLQRGGSGSVRGAAELLHQADHHQRRAGQETHEGGLLRQVRETGVAIGQRLAVVAHFA